MSNEQFGILMNQIRNGEKRVLSKEDVGQMSHSQFEYVIDNLSNSIIRISLRMKRLIYRSEQVSMSRLQEDTSTWD